MAIIIVSVLLIVCIYVWIAYGFLEAVMIFCGVLGFILLISWLVVKMGPTSSPPPAASQQPRRNTSPRHKSGHNGNRGRNARIRRNRWEEEQDDYDYIQWKGRHHGSGGRRYDSGDKYDPDEYDSQYETHFDDDD